MLVSVFTHGVGAPDHAFMVYSDLKPEDLVRIHERVFYEEALRRPMLLHEGVSDTVMKAYISFDRYPYLPFRAYRQMKEDKIWERDGYFPRTLRAMVEDLMEFGPFMGFISTMPKVPPDPTVPFLLDPETLEPLYFSSYVTSRNLREEVKERVESVVQSLVEEYLPLLRRIKIVGWIPKALFKEPAVVLDLAFLHIYLGQLSIMAKSADVRRMLYASIIARAISRRGFHKNRDVSEWVYANIILSSIPAHYISPLIAYPYVRPDVDHMGMVLSRIGFLSSVRPKFMFMKSPVYRLAEFLHKSGMGAEDVIVTSRDPRVIELIYPSTTFSFVPILYRFTGDVSLKEIKHYAGTWTVSEKELTRTPTDIFMKHYSTAILLQAAPNYLGSREMSELRDELIKYPEYIPEKFYIRSRFHEKNFLIRKARDVLSIIDVVSGSFSGVTDLNQ